MNATNVSFLNIQNSRLHFYLTTQNDDNQHQLINIHFNDQTFQATCFV